MPVLKTWVQSVLSHPFAKGGLALLCGLPMVWLVWAAAANGLGANPAEALIRSTGDWTLRSLCVLLAVSPLRVWGGLPQVARFRRLLGLNVFAYGSAHLLAYAWLDMGLDVADVWADVTKRPFILVGFCSWLVLLALAATSFNAAVRFMGAARWKRLHRLVYALAALAILHFWWMRTGKHNFTEVWVYASVLAILLCARWIRPRGGL